MDPISAPTNIASFYADTSGLTKGQGMGQGFEDLLEAAANDNRSGRVNNEETMKKTAKAMEAQLVTFMLNTMDKASPGGGMLGKSEGLGYFKSLFFQTMAEEVVEHNGLGFEESLKNMYGTNNLEA